MNNSNTIISFTTIGVDNWRILLAPVHHNGITIPECFAWNGASVPKLANWILQRWGEASISHLKHDFLYDIRSSYLSLTRKEADKTLYEDLVNAGISKFRAKTVYYAVRLFGASSYKQGV